MGVIYIKDLVCNSKSRVQSPALYIDTPVSSSVEHAHVGCLEHVHNNDAKLNMEEDSIKVYGKETGYEDVDWIQVATAQWWAFVNTTN
jgi:hypothetical protein